MYGEDGLKDMQNQGNQYQSWNFYNQNFGIYDNDPEVITLTRSDFSTFVLFFNYLKYNKLTYLFYFSSAICRVN